MVISSVKALHNVYINLNTSRPILVESLQLYLAGTLYPSDWKSETLYTDSKCPVCFDLPLDILRGKRTVKLKAIIDGEEYWFGKDTKELPEAFPHVK